MGKRSILRILTSFVFLLTACSQNFIGSFTNPNTDTALYSEALININASNWKQAITDIQAMSPAAQNARTTMFTFATALAGQCGFQLLNFMQGIETAWSGGGTPSAIMLTMMQAYQNTTVNMLVGATAPVAATDSTQLTYCSWAQQVMDNIQTTYGAWTADEQVFVVFFSLAKIGMMLKYTAGAGATMSGGLLIADNTFNACSTANLPDFYASQISTGLALFLQNYTSISFLSSLSVPYNGTNYTLTSVLCGTTTPELSMNFCNHTTPATVTANDILNIRSIMTSSTTSAVGLGVLTLLDKTEPTSQSKQSNPSVPPGIWQCDDTALTSPTFPPNIGTEGLLNCCS